MSGEPDSFARTVADVEAQALAKGRVVVYPSERELFVDIDSEDDLVRFRAHFTLLSEQPDLLAGFSVVDSPSGLPGHKHVTVRMRRPVASPLERLALQAMLGSDLKRELLSYRNLLSGADAKAVTVFFKKPAAESGIAF